MCVVGITKIDLITMISCDVNVIFMKLMHDVTSLQFYYVGNISDIMSVNQP